LVQRLDNEPLGVDAHRRWRTPGLGDEHVVVVALPGDPGEDDRALARDGDGRRRDVRLVGLVEDRQILSSAERQPARLGRAVAATRIASAAARSVII
jgi:hypothetical protein